MRDNICAWIAHMLPRRVVMACLLRAVWHSVEMDRHRGIAAITASDLICEWSEVVNGDTRERR